MKGLFISFEGTEACGKSTQLGRLQKRIRRLGLPVRAVREPGATSIGEEIRHTLQHSAKNSAMTAETELFLVNASRAQLVREIIRPSLEKGEVILCDRFFDSTVAYQGYGRGLDLVRVEQMIELAVGPTRPDLTILLVVPFQTSARRLEARRLKPGALRDRMEEAEREFFLRVEHGYGEIARRNPARVRVVDGAQKIATVEAAIWREVEPLLAERQNPTTEGRGSKELRIPGA